ncbi:DUF6493 family protein [Chryseobacterium sp. MEBOG07]|uniref:DUF7824 domain-containing protein n=1 Tax=Chryseobacterium sp. MEBOG07 TaxID=2879939 RepID=UPI0021D413C9|nr:DUF6493 family protein [Chryseobacterium sp. MEBOG07]
MFPITHAPCWVSPVTLVERLENYQNNNTEPHHLDIHLALQRCALDDTSKAIVEVEKRLKGEYRELLLFFFGRNAKPEGKFEHPSWWMTAGITRSPETVFEEFRSFGYDDIPVEFFSGDYKWKTIDSKKNSYYPVELNITIPKYHLEKEKSLFSWNILLLSRKSFQKFPH